jgi:hypothetical protein
MYPEVKNSHGYMKIKPLMQSTLLFIRPPSLIKQKGGAKVIPNLPDLGRVFKN